MQNRVTVRIWGKEVGMLMWDSARKRAIFEYNSQFLKGGLDIAPLTASIYEGKYRHPFYGEKNDNIYFGLPAFISDSLPGRWGNTVFSAWADANHVAERDLTPVDKLSFIGQRAMGALEFEPAQPMGKEREVALAELYQKAQDIFESREDIAVNGEDLSLENLYEVGTSAGGQHTKAVIAIHNQTGQIRSGQIMMPEEYTYYLLKFAEKDYYPLTVVEYVYSLMAAQAGIYMMPCKLIEIGGDMHFMTERFDRVKGKKIHTQSLAAMNPEATSYEDLMLVCDALRLPYAEREQTYRRTVFNVLTCNVDAHIKNFSFMMAEDGQWHITPAYDLTFSCFCPGNRYDPTHALRINGKGTNITPTDLLEFAKRFAIKNANRIIRETVDAVMQFRQLATKHGVALYWIDQIEQHLHEMNPELLADMQGWRPYQYAFEMDGVQVREAVCQEMNNGAIRLSAILNDKEMRITLSAKSEYALAIRSAGACKMSQADMMHFVKELLFPKL